MINKYVFYLGLNDKETKKQEIATSAAIEKIARYFGGVTITEATGAYVHDDGAFVVEKTLKIEKLDFDGDFDMIAAAEDLKAMFNQESVAVESAITNSQLI